VRVIYLGALEEGGEATDCYAAEVAAEAPVPEGCVAEGLRQLYPLLPEPFVAVAGRAVQLIAYDRQNQFCGQCGGRTVDQEHERAKRCPQCGLVVYPRLSPAMIIAVTRQTDDGLKILLARNHRFPTGRFSVLAGYVEPGESLEACCAREVCEEVGIDIANIRYFGSQPWPFPNSLMIGFTADYAGGEIRLEESELAEARWFAADQLPGIPPPFTIARRLIDWFVALSAT
jgi:NAD+ diphosphatase